MNVVIYMECCNKKTVRDNSFKEDLTKRINRITGQMEGIKKMIDTDRYCQDVLIQLSAVEKSIRSLSSIILKNHMSNCIKDSVKNSDLTIIDELLELMKRYM